MLGNAEGLVDLAGEGEVPFGAFMWFYDLIMHAVTLFNGKANNGRVATSEVGNFLNQMGYANLDARTVKVRARFALFVMAFF